MNRLIKTILYITAGCVGIGCAALILGIVLGRSTGEMNAAFGEVKSAARDIRELARKKMRYGQAYSHDDIEAYTEYGDGHGTCQNLDHGVVEESDEAEESTLLQEGTQTESAGSTLDSLAFAEAESTAGADSTLAVDMSEVDDLVIRLHHGGLEIYESGDDKIRVSVYESRDGIQASCSNGKLSIQDNRKSFDQRDDAYVSLEIPDNKKFRVINAQIDAGYLYAEPVSMYADQVTLSADAGEIVAESLQADSLTASVGAGTIDLSECVCNGFDLDCGVGTIDLGVSLSGDAKVHCGMGCVYVELYDGIESTNYELDCGMGCIDIGDETYSALAHSKKIDNGAASVIRLDCGMGTIEITD